MGTTTAISHMPIEVFNRILDSLHDDGAALCSASLVSREWVRRPQYHLFHRTAVTEIYGRGYVIKDNVRAFLALVKSEHCTILSAIRCIILLVTTPELMQDLFDILKRKSRALSEMIYVHCADSISYAITHGLPNIRDFALDFHTSFNIDNNAWSLVSSFRSLHNLSIYTNCYGTFALPPDMSGPPFRDLCTLRLRLVPSEELFHWLQNLDGSHFVLDTLDLRMLRSNPNGWGSVKALNSFLKGISATLKHLSLGIDYYGSINNIDHSSDAEAPRTDLSQLVNIQSLGFRTHDLKSVCDSLESVDPSAMIEALTVNVVPWGGVFKHTPERCNCLLDGNHLARLSRIVEGRPFVRTEVQVNLNIWKNWEPDTMRGLVEKWSTQRSVLKLSYYAHKSNVRDHQRNTQETLRHHLVWRRQPRPVPILVDPTL